MITEKCESAGNRVCHNAKTFAAAPSLKIG